MVSRIDLDRLRALNTPTSSPEWRRAQRVLWDSGSVTDLIELPMSRVHFPPRPERLLLFSYAHVMNARHEAEVTLRSTPLGEERTWYAPELYFFQTDGHFASRGYQYYCAPDGTTTMDKTLYYGMPFEAGSVRWERAEVADNLLVPEETWWLHSRQAQAAQWCITYPEQFPILRQSGLGDTTEKNRAKRKAIEKAKLVLPDVQIIELRPRVTEGAHTRPSVPTGHSRDYHYSFEVSGHIRHLKSGKTTYVSPHWKAVDKPRLERLTVRKF